MTPDKIKEYEMRLINAKQALKLCDESDRVFGKIEGVNLALQYLWEIMYK